MFRSIHRNLILAAGFMALAAACSASSGGGNVFTTASSGGPGGNGQGGTGTGANTGQGAGDVGGAIDISVGSGTSTGSGTTTCNNAPDIDGDGDGWTTAEGDCNDCDPNVNPGAVDVATTADGGASMVDSDCNGVFDPPEPCDTGLAIDSMNAIDAAKAVELCRVASQNPPNKKDRTWGVVHAEWVLPDGANPSTLAPTFGGSVQLALANYHLGHGMLSGFGPNVNVQAGKKMLGLSSGTARQPTDPGYSSVGGFDKTYTTGSPAGFPKESPACPGTLTGTPHDAAAVELTIRTPTNATGFTFDFNFFTYEWPVFVCSQYNDFFVALLSPIPMGQADGNISFDSTGNPVSVNNALVDVCDCATTGFNTSSCSNPPPGGCCAKNKPFACALGTTGLQGTGFDGHASTGWLVTKAPVKGGETITIRWTVYDSGDGSLDSSTLIDNWQWIANGGTVVVGTDPIKTPQ